MFNRGGKMQIAQSIKKSNQVYEAIIQLFRSVIKGASLKIKLNEYKEDKN